MSNLDIVRAWKDEEYRNSLTEAQRSQLPENPAGAIELSNLEAETVAGGGWTQGVLFTGRKAFSNGTLCDLIRGE